uniref:Uncharacterized protein n=1 Tax=Cuerna arida TaxID=1464854 RepID=A0A1B6FT64_9HEMI
MDNREKTEFDGKNDMLIDNQIQQQMIRQQQPSIMTEREPDVSQVKKTKVDMKSLPARCYLDQTVVPILLHGLAFINKERPQDPIGALANFLVKNKSNYDQLTNNVISTTASSAVDEMPLTVTTTSTTEAVAVNETVVNEQSIDVEPIVAAETEPVVPVTIAPVVESVPDLPTDTIMETNSVAASESEVKVEPIVSSENLSPHSDNNNMETDQNNYFDANNMEEGSIPPQVENSINGSNDPQ